VVRETDSGREVARYEPGGRSRLSATMKKASERAPEKKSSVPAAGDTDRKNPTSDALLRLRAANQRLQEIVQPLIHKRKDKP
jgi:hypothetical protein